MGTTFEVHLYAADRARAVELFEAAYEEIERVEAALSNYRRRASCRASTRRPAGARSWTDPEVFALVARASTTAAGAKGLSTSPAAA